MSHFHNNALIGASGQGGGYNLESSLRLRGDASAYLSRTPTTAGNQKTWTWSGWIKRARLGGQGYLFGSIMEELILIYIFNRLISCNLFIIQAQ